MAFVVLLRNFALNLACANCCASAGAAELAEWLHEGQGDIAYDLLYFTKRSTISVAIVSKISTVSSPSLLFRHRRAIAPPRTVGLSLLLFPHPLPA